MKRVGVRRSKTAVGAPVNCRRRLVCSRRWMSDKCCSPDICPTSDKTWPRTQPLPNRNRVVPRAAKRYAAVRFPFRPLLEQAADRTEAAAVDHCFSSPTENVSVAVCLDTGEQTDDCFVIVLCLPARGAIQIPQLQLQYGHAQQ